MRLTRQAQVLSTAAAILAAFGMAASGGVETLYNGIVLPAEWPLKVTQEELRSRKPTPEPATWFSV